MDYLLKTTDCDKKIKQQELEIKRMEIQVRKQELEAQKKGMRVCFKHKVVTMLFQQLVNKICLQYCRFVASLLTSCDNAVPTTYQQDVFAINL